MKKLIITSLTAALLVFSTFTGCVKSSSSPTNPVGAIPDIANFLVDAATTFVSGLAANIHINSSTLGDGTFTVGFNMSGNNVASGLTAALTMSGGVGTFSTPVLSESGPTVVTVTSISNSAGGHATPTTNNVSSMFDSTGVMNATYTPAAGSAKIFKATDVKATLTGSMLNIHGVMWEPDLSTINLTINNYTHALGTVSFNFMDATSLNGNASYGFSGMPTISELSQHGTITLTSVTPLLTGSFNITNNDSSKVVGTFTCTAP